ncbi:hypothetical protein, partial [Enterococcus faecium]
MKKRASLLVLVALLFNIFSYGVAVSAETYIPKDPGNIWFYNILCWWKIEGDFLLTLFLRL